MKASDILQSALDTLTTEIAGLTALKDALQRDETSAITRAVKLIQASKGRLILTGMGKSGHIGRKLAATFSSTGTPAYFVHPGEASHGDLGMIRKEDVVLALSWSGETAELSDILAYSGRFNVPLIAVTSNPASNLAKSAQVVLLLPKAAEACPNGLAPTTSTTMQLALGDALAVALLAKRGFKAEDFRAFHPGGKLGAQLKRVQHIMRKAPDIPLIAQSASVAEAAAVMSTYTLGCVGLTDSSGCLVGVISDGDLRRHLGEDGLLASPAHRIMNLEPKTIAPDALAGQAIEQINARKITALFVIDPANKPIGVVHIHDLLKIGAA